ncbi:MAG TPA: ATP-binding cassette domain-containing protein [Gammaproteobacteria bacterium]
MNAGVIKCRNLVPAGGKSPQTFNLEIGRNTLTCIVGPADSGKTSYLRLLGGIDPPVRGELEILGYKIWSLHENARRQLRLYAAYVLPNSALLSSVNALQNIMLPAQYHCMGTDKHIEERALALLAWLGYPDSNDDRPASELPAMHQRLIAIARSLILDPEILFIDDAFAFFDAAGSRRMAGLYLEMRDRHDLTLVLTTDNTAFAREQADLVLYTQSGLDTPAGSEADGNRLRRRPDRVDNPHNFTQLI